MVHCFWFRIRLIYATLDQKDSMLFDLVPKLTRHFQPITRFIVLVHNKISVRKWRCFEIYGVYIINRSYRFLLACFESLKSFDEPACKGPTVCGQIRQLQEMQARVTKNEDLRVTENEDLRVTEKEGTERYFNKKREITSYVKRGVRLKTQNIVGVGTKEGTSY